MFKFWTEIVSESVVQRSDDGNAQSLEIRWLCAKYNAMTSTNAFQVFVHHGQVTGIKDRHTDNAGKKDGLMLWGRQEFFQLWVNQVDIVVNFAPELR